MLRRAAKSLTHRGLAALAKAPLDAERDLDESLPMADVKSGRALQVMARAFGRLGRERARAGDVTPQQAEALQLVAERGATSTSAVALLLGIDPSTASRNLAGLERAGYILRRRGAEDARQTDVRLTPRGRRVADALASEWMAAYVSLLERIPRAERQRVAEAVDVLARILEGDGPG
jgi:DNA-binding MarR family transcriptional regulator